MASQILLPKNIDVTKITFGAAKTLNGGARIVPVSYDGKQFIFQTARMTCNYGLSKWGEGPTAKFSLDGSFKNKEMNKSLDNFYNFLSKLDEYMVEKGVENSVEWLKKKHNSKDVVAAIYTNALRVPKDKDTGEYTDKYPPSFKMNLPFKEGKCMCNVYDKDEKLIDIMALGQNIKGATVSGIIKCTGVWLAGGNFGLTFRLEQLRIEPSQNMLNGYAFQNDDENVCVENEDDEHEECEHTEPLAKAVEETHIDTSDDEEDEDAIDPPAPVAPPTATKKAAASKGRKTKE